jgi:hypothetical protein
MATPQLSRHGAARQKLDEVGGQAAGVSLAVMIATRVAEMVTQFGEPCSSGGTRVGQGQAGQWCWTV